MEDDEGEQCHSTTRTGCWNTASYSRYQRLGGTGSSSRRSFRVELPTKPRRIWRWNTQPTAGSASQRLRCRRGWRIKVTPRLHFLRRLMPTSSSVSPCRIITRVRDAYVRLMLRVASGGAALSSGGYGFSAESFQRPLPQSVLKAKEYEVKALAEVYRKMVAEGRVLGVGGVAGGVGGGSGRWARA